MAVKDAIVSDIITFVMENAHTTGDTLDKELEKFRIKLRETVKWYFKRDEYKKDVEPALREVTKNLESSLAAIPVSDPKFINKLREKMTDVINFVHLYISLSR